MFKKCLGLVFLLMIFHSGCRQTSPTHRYDPMRAAAVEEKTALVGRFRMELPATWKMSQSVFMLAGATIEEEHWPEASSDSDTWKSRWEARMVEVRATDYDWPDVDQVVLEVREFAPSMPGVLYHGGYHSHNLRWLALRPTFRGGVWFEVEFEKERTAELAMQIGELASAYQLVEGGAKSPGFYTRDGVLPLSYAHPEETFVRFEGINEEVVLTVETRSVMKPHTPAGFSGPRSLLARGLRIFGGGADVVRAARRVVGGLEGREEVLRWEDESGRGLKCWWLAPGEADSGRRPRFEIDLKIRGDDEDEALAVWDRFLDSIRPVSEAE